MYATSFQYQKGAIKTPGRPDRPPYKSKTFQYQKGAIKTILLIETSSFMRYFQYQKGAIKTAAASVTYEPFVRFQYQKGAIKTLRRVASDALLWPPFNTKKVRLKLSVTKTKPKI